MNEIASFSKKNQKLIQNICNPLVNFLDIPYYFYHTIESDGSFTCLTNYPEELHYFFHQNLHLHSPFLCHPSILRSGIIYDASTSDIKHQNVIREEFNMGQLFMDQVKMGSKVECVALALKATDRRDLQFFLANLDLLNKFKKYFIREAHDLIQKARHEKHNLALLKPHLFTQFNEQYPLHKNSKEENFLDAILPLTSREKECLDLFQRGYSAQATAGILGLSARTIESYFENIKNKLGCHSKWDLF